MLLARSTAGGCPIELEGLLEVWLLRSGRLALVCDECDATWLDRTNVAYDTADFPVPDPDPLPRALGHGRSLRNRAMAWLRLVVPTRRRTVFMLHDGDVLLRPATVDEIRARGWDDLQPSAD
jgi:hypothetical protein